MIIMDWPFKMDYVFPYGDDTDYVFPYGNDDDEYYNEWIGFNGYTTIERTV